MSRAEPNAFVTTLHLTVRSSSTQKLFVAALHTVAAGVMIALVPYRPWLAIVLIFVAGSAYWELQRALRQTRTSILRLRWTANDAWHWQTANGRWHEGVLASAFVAGTGLIVLILKEHEQRLRRTPCLLFYDALSERAHRHLRARLTVNPPRQQSLDG